MGHFISGTYPPDWPQISFAAKERAGFRCERCGHPAEGPWKMGDRALGELRQRAGYEIQQAEGLGRRACDERCSHPDNGKQRMLTVDHILGDKNQNQWWALAALCQVCHLQFQGRVRVEQGWTFEVSEWLKPHLAGFFAWRLLGQDVSQKDTESRMNELLALGLPRYAETEKPPGGLTAGANGVH